ncbi:MAG: hypothetical protein LBL28_03590, partial [Treponema sp.]|nr:hypothetical protein [Treponema sp.]
TESCNELLLNAYLGLLKTLSPKYKRRLAASLMDTVSEEPPEKAASPAAIAESVNRFYGAWQSDKSAEDMIAEIRSDRRNINRIVAL